MEKILIQQNNKMIISGCTELMGCTNWWLFEDGFNQIFMARVES